MQIAALWNTQVSTADSMLLTPKQLLDLKKSTLVEQGIEPNPVPGTAKMHVYTVNTQSGNGVWALLDFAAAIRNQELCVFGLQETRLSLEKPMPFIGLPKNEVSSFFTPLALCQRIVGMPIATMVALPGLWTGDSDPASRTDSVVTPVS